MYSTCGIELCKEHQNDPLLTHFDEIYHTIKHEEYRERCRSGNYTNSRRWILEDT